MTNQHTTVLYVVPTVLSVLCSLLLGGHLGKGSIVRLSLSLALGMSPYLYLPLSSHFKAMDSWGDMRTLDGFLHHFLRREYGTFQLAADGTTADPGMWSRLLVYSSVLAEESLYIAPFLAVVGLSSLLLRKNWALRLTGITFALDYALYMAVFHYLANLDLTPLFLGVQARFWQQANLFIYLWAGIGVHALCELFIKHTKARRALLIAVVATYSVSQCALNFNTLNNRENYVFYNHGSSVLEGLPKNALVLLNGDINNNALKYPQQCEEERTDLRLLSLQLMTWDWWKDMQGTHHKGVKLPGTKFHPHEKGGFSFKTFLDKNYKRFPIFLCGPFKEGDDTWKGYYDILPYGHCNQILKTKDHAKANITSTLVHGYKTLAKSKALGVWHPDKYTAGTWERVVYADSWSRRVYLSSFASFHANQNLSNIPLLEHAYNVMTDLFEDPELLKLLQENEMLNADTFRGGGIIYGQYAKALLNAGGKGSEEKAAFLERRTFDLWKEYLALAPEDDQIGRLVNDRFNPYTGRKVP